MFRFRASRVHDSVLSSSGIDPRARSRRRARCGHLLRDSPRIRCAGARSRRSRGDRQRLERRVVRLRWNRQRAHARPFRLARDRNRAPGGSLDQPWAHGGDRPGRPDRRSQRSRGTNRDVRTIAIDRSPLRTRGEMVDHDRAARRRGALGPRRPTPGIGRRRVGIVRAAGLPGADSTSSAALRMDRGNLAENFEPTNI